MISGTIEGVDQRRHAGISVFDVVVSPPSNPFSIQRHSLLSPVDRMTERKGVFRKRQKELRQSENETVFIVGNNCYIMHTIKHAVCQRSTRNDWYVAAITSIRVTVTGRILSEDTNK